MVYPFKQMPLRSHKLDAIQPDFVKIPLRVENILRNCPEEATGVASGMLSEKSHLVEPTIGLRRALMDFPRPTAPYR